MKSNALKKFATPRKVDVIFQLISINELDIHDEVFDTNMALELVRVLYFLFKIISILNTYRGNPNQLSLSCDWSDSAIA